MSWQPSASIVRLKQRSHILRNIRQFFEQRQVTEVETPAMSHFSVTDQYLQAFETRFHQPGDTVGLPLYLQTSPEYAMKRLLAAGSGCIYQISKAFRNEESGRFHNPEFTMLEWYRVGFDHHQLMHEVDELLQSVLKTPSAEYMTYQQAFIQVLSTDPLSASIEQLQEIARQQGFDLLCQQLTDKDDLLQLLFSQCVESSIGQIRPCFVYDFPAGQASLAKISKRDPRVAERFEVYFKGVELANGFHELTDPKEQRVRFEQDNTKRIADGLCERQCDERLLAALAHGLPDCAGVALGIDRLMLLALEAEHINEVISFPIETA